MIKSSEVQSISPSEASAGNAGLDEPSSPPDQAKSLVERKMLPMTDGDCSSRDLSPTIAAVTSGQSLKPCPFCGGEAEIWRATPGTTRKAWIACVAGCLALTKEHETDAAAVTTWNRRDAEARATQAEAERDAAREALRPFADIARAFGGEAVVEVCRPHPANPSTRIYPMLGADLRKAAEVYASLTQPEKGEG